ncbi:MAG: ribonuclease E/G [Proteobacteria bacterium]|nr:ribonuclease E/G [Pseudomonadota bacterium]
MKKKMLINAIDEEQSRMAIVDGDGKLTEFNIQMSIKEPTTGNIYKGVAVKVERGLQAAFVDYGGSRNGFLPLRDVNPEYLPEQKGDMKESKPTLKAGQEVLVQVQREGKDRKGAMLTTYLSLAGRYLVLIPNKQSSGISRKIEDEADRKKLKELMSQINRDEKIGYIIRTAGINRTKQELSRDYQRLLRLWNNIQKKAQKAPTPSLIYQESDFGVRSIRDYFTPDINEIRVDDIETFRKMKDYCKAVSPRSINLIKHYSEKTPIFDKYQIEDQIAAIYRERVSLRSGGYIIINPTEAMITIDVNSGRSLSKKNIEQTAFQTNLEAAEEIARQLRLRDLGGLIIIDFIDMMDSRHNAEVERTFKKALSLDRSRIQLLKISKLGTLELSRQKKQSTIQEISYTTCPHCKGSGLRPSLEYTALGVFRKIKSEMVKRDLSAIKIKLPYEVANYLLNQKRGEINKFESLYDTSIHISGSPDIEWGESKFEFIKRKEAAEAAPIPENNQPKTAAKQDKSGIEPAKRKPYARKPKAIDKPSEPVTAETAEREAAGKKDKHPSVLSQIINILKK